MVLLVSVLSYCIFLVFSRFISAYYSKQTNVYLHNQIVIHLWKPFLLQLMPSFKSHLALSSCQTLFLSYMSRSASKLGFEPSFMWNLILMPSCTNWKYIKFGRPSCSGVFCSSSHHHWTPTRSEMGGTNTISSWYLWKNRLRREM